MNLILRNTDRIEISMSEFKSINSISVTRLK